ncbi:MAG: hypothetical protein GXP26_15150 [Planctomycetes bacterium]|nr:hypothetical protein [Planctomycetota bacterium]
MTIDGEPSRALQPGQGVGYFATRVEDIATLAALDLTKRPIRAAPSTLPATLGGTVFACDFEPFSRRCFV